MLLAALFFRHNAAFISIRNITSQYIIFFLQSFSRFSFPLKALETLRLSHCMAAFCWEPLNSCRPSFGWDEKICSLKNIAKTAGARLWADKQWSPSIRLCRASRRSMDRMSGNVFDMNLPLVFDCDWPLTKLYLVRLLEHGRTRSVLLHRDCLGLASMKALPPWSYSLTAKSQLNCSWCN